MLVSVWAPPHLVQQGQFAVEVAVSCLNFYTDYFGIPYQLPKIGKQCYAMLHFIEPFSDFLRCLE